MKQSQDEILKAIAEFQPVDGNWLGLESLLEELWLHPVSTSWVVPLLSVFGRFPEEDGAGVFWSIIHGLETIPGYESVLSESQRHCPCEFKAIMLKRIENAKKTSEQ